MAAVLASGTAAAWNDSAVLPPLKSIRVLGTTVPGNGDVNPYGMAQVRRSTGNLVAGHILISNFNNSQNQQGTGTTIVEMAPNGALTLFATLDAATLPGPCPGGVGLTTALVVLDSGWVIVGSLPTSDGTSATAQAGCLIVLDASGNAVETLYGSLINGPWDMTAFEYGGHAKLFVTNVLNGTVAANGAVVNEGTVTRLDLALPGHAMPALEAITVIGSGFAERTDPAALVIGPTGVALERDSARLYVADTLNNRVTAIDDALERTGPAGTGRTLSAGGTLNAPLGLIVTENGELLTVNGGDGNVTEIDPHGRQVAHTQLDASGSPPGAGALFGLVFDAGHGLYYVDDATNTLNLLHR
ncbi:MAG: SMP-30/gluconolactonase/LRE family protein [Gammaproteobacteria bacterium]|nr:SMP-30/gluconolactonase/LRE family protein [Gammaproteobacteria bacterium]